MINQTGFNKLKKDYGGITKIPLDLIKQVDNDVLKQLSKENQSNLVENIIDYWQSKGFPYDVYSLKEIGREYKLLMELDVRSLAKGKGGKEIGRSPLGLGSASTFHPYRYEVQCRTFKTPVDNFNDRKRLKKILIKAIKFSGNPMKLTSFKTMLKVFSGTHMASNFRPSAAKFIYTKFCPPGGKVLDPSLGFSGRLLGALTSHIGLYEGCDPCKKIFDGGQNLLKAIRKIGNKNSKFSGFFNEDSCAYTPKIILHNIPFEEYDNEPNIFDLTFTSPPYFNVEKYSNEDTQSWKKFDSYEKWLQGFLLPSIKTCYKVLKPGGYMIYNVAGKKPPIEKDTIRLGTEIFGKLYDTYWLRLGKMFGTRNHGQEENDRRDCKIEPIYIFRKES